VVIIVDASLYLLSILKINNGLGIWKDDEKLKGGKVYE